MIFKPLLKDQWTAKDVSVCLGVWRRVESGFALISIYPAHITILQHTVNPKIFVLLPVSYHYCKGNSDMLIMMGKWQKYMK